MATLNRNPDLPEDMVLEILSRLPVKSVLRCKAVCKSWLSLISSSCFVKTHLSISTNDDPHGTHHHHLLTIGYPECIQGTNIFESRSVYSLLNEPAPETIKIDNPICKDIGDNIDVLGCCNGLVCLTNFRRMLVFLWNPSTRKIRTLPQPIVRKDLLPQPTDRRRKNLLRPPRLGVCYDESTDDFKLFSITPDRPYEQKVSVYSLKSNTWRSIGDDIHYSFQLYDGMLADGAIHWVAKKQNMECKTIFSVDIKNETFSELDFPTTNEQGMDNWLPLGTFGKNLSVVHNDLGQVWVFKESDGKKSWTKVLTIPVSGQPFPHPDLRPLCIFVNGDILLRKCETLWLYNSKDTTFKVLLHENHLNVYRAFIYVESLVSP